MPDTEEGDESAPGWEAIDAAIKPLVGKANPVHWGTGTSLPDQGGLWGVSGYERGDHWFYITYGLSELFGKVSDDLSTSGWGEELTMRLLRGGANAVPDWPAKLLARLGEIVYQRAAPFLPGGRMLIPDHPADVPPAVCWAPDPELPAIETPHGRLVFVATVGVDEATMQRMRSSTTDQVLDAIRETNPLLVSGRPPLTW